MLIQDVNCHKFPIHKSCSHYHPPQPLSTTQNSPPGNSTSPFPTLPLPLPFFARTPIFEVGHECYLLLMLTIYPSMNTRVTEHKPRLTRRGHQNLLFAYWTEACVFGERDGEDGEEGRSGDGRV